MPTIKLSKTGEVLFKFPAIDILDEFIPFVRFFHEKYVRPKTFKVINASRATTLSDVYDSNCRTFTPKHISTGLDFLTKPKGWREIKLPFIIDPGNSSTLDKNGKIQVKISPAAQGVKAIFDGTKVYQIGDVFNLRIEVKGHQDRTFNVDFYATDNEDFNQGELQNLLCGRVVVTIFGTSKVSLKMLENISNLDIAKVVNPNYTYPATNTNKASEIELSQMQANLYQDCLGVCYATCESRANKAYFDLYGRNVVNLAVSKDNIDHRIAATVRTKDPYMGYGAGGVFAYHKLGVAVDNAAIWNGKLKTGALLQRWESLDPNDLFSHGGHSVIFRAYRYNETGEIDGIEITDYHGGINGGFFDVVEDDFPWTKGEYQKKYTLLGVNLLDLE
ncbi:MAG TPA: hypothetical protein PK208_03385 [Fibrobacteria bacterium]|nr:hypothetical protein [Fibrobacteria bacterium]